jgi:nicotinate-nucleotide pyrophosphorylase (carboxylating)
MPKKLGNDRLLPQIATDGRTQGRKFVNGFASRTFSFIGGWHCCILHPRAMRLSALLDRDTRRLVREALAEDVGNGDVTTEATISAQSRSRAEVIARQPLVLAGIDVTECVFAQVSSKIQATRKARDGQKLRRSDVILELSGPTRALLTAERVALNFLQRLSGVATLTAQYVAAVHGTGAKIFDTRKTTPGLRRLEKYAVACGGGQNHRIGLFDMVLIKDNHLAALSNEKPNAIAAAVERARRKYPRLKVEVEADGLGQVRQAVEAGADVILLDNMSLAQLRAAVQLARIGGFGPRPRLAGA